MENKHIKWIFVIIAAFIVLEIITIILGLALSLTYWESFRIVFGSIYVLFIPGWIWSFVFFNNQGEKKIDLIERIALSFALSIAIVPLVVFYLNLIGLRISAFSSFFVILVLIVIGLIFAFLWKRKK
jgi:uncharacterized membrane protein